MEASSAVPPADRRRRLLVHLDSVYTLAQALAPDAERAVQLVEETYREAFAMQPLAHTAQDDKRWLLQALTRIHREGADVAPAAPAAPLPATEALQALRSRLARQIAEAALPAVFATLPERQRLLLLLCEAEDLACPEAGQVLGLDAETACQELAKAHEAVEAALHADASARERDLLAANLPEGWLAEALPTAVAAAFGPVPASLRPALEAVIEAKATTLPDPPRLALPLPPPAPNPKPPPRQGYAPRPGRLRRVASILALVTLVALLGYAATRTLDRPPETNLIALSVAQADAIEPTFETNNPQDAEEYVRGRLNRLLTLPTIDGARLVGVGIHEAAPEAAVPVFLYEEEGEGAGRTLALYVYNYTLLDRHATRLQLEVGILRQIEEERRFDLHDLGRRQVLVWRHRDDIYVAVTTGDAELLSQRILFPS